MVIPECVGHRLEKHRAEIFGRLSEVLNSMPAGDAKTRLRTLCEELKPVVQIPGSPLDMGTLSLASSPTVARGVVVVKSPTITTTTDPITDDPTTSGPILGT